MNPSAMLPLPQPLGAKREREREMRKRERDLRTTSELCVGCLELLRNSSETFFPSDPPPN